MTPTRRSLLRGAGACALGAASLGGVGAALSAFRAGAADVSGYKALVCVFLLGGMDNHDTLIPYDQPSYDRYAAIRSSLMAEYAAQPGGSSRARDRLLPLAPDNAADFGTRQFALPEDMAGLRALFDAGDMAVLANVGPLIEPLTRAEWEAETAQTPKRLFSHNDQQSTWLASEPEGAQFGWGGRFADAVLSAGANSASEFTTITGLGNEVFLTGEQARPYQVGLAGAAEVDALLFFEQNRATPEGEQAYQLLRSHFQAMGFLRANLVERDVAAAMAGSLETNEQFNDALASAPTLTTAFPESFLGQQLQAVAQTISIRGPLGVSRQVFFVAIGGFDTHSRQAPDLPGLQRDIDQGVTAFYAAMDELGLGFDVTMF
ncbi:MAG: DUF1501 domain-containing protein, partial [Caulobacterales bacterium]|nr:DUF1501 domain-containing protein [Caulobacterales bacterium]